VPPIKFELKIRDRVLGATVNLPSEPIRPVQLLPLFHKITDAIVSATIPEQLEISCRAGCAACCRYFVPLAESEAFFLADLIEGMEPDRKAALKARFDALLIRLRSVGMLERIGTEALIEQEPRRSASIDYLQFELACPFLENESCSIYEHRPMVCREYLVASPPEYCAAASQQAPARLNLPVVPSNALFCFGDGKGNEPSKVVALPLLLEFASANRVEEQPLLPAPQVFENFLQKLTE
jgi:Fe-S-cluster containining protein